MALPRDIDDKIATHNLDASTHATMHRSTPSTYISGTGTAGADNTAQTVKSVSLAANTMTQVGDRLRVRVFWRGDTGTPITATLKVGPSGAEVTVASGTDAGGVSLFEAEAWLHYIDNTHANVIETGAIPATRPNSAANVAGFTWDAAQVILVAQDAIANNHVVVYAIIVDLMPKG